MEEDRFIKAARASGRAGEGGWKPGVGQVVGVALCVILLLAVVILGVTTGIGLVLAVPFGVLALVAALVLFRGRPRRDLTVCPVCNARFDAPAHMAEFDCPSCGSRLEATGGVVRRAA